MLDNRKSCTVNNQHNKIMLVFRCITGVELFPNIPVKHYVLVLFEYFILIMYLFILVIAGQRG